MYDIIGDIHGHYEQLVTLLKSLGYTKKDGTYAHPERKVIFTGDIINRGPKIRAAVNLVRSMVDAGNAMMVLGNHELNAILYATFDKTTGKSIRKRLARYKLPLMKTLEAYEAYPDEFDSLIKWFRHQPLYIDMGEIRVVHGAWNDHYIAVFEKHRKGEAKLKKSLLKTYLNDKELNTAMNGLIKGEEFQLPKDLLLKDSSGMVRHSFRIKWWEAADEKTFKEIAFGNRFELPAYTIPKELLPEISPYPETAPPVFLGHYCLNKKAKLFRGNICCIDTCVVRSQKLTCYRWQGEKVLTDAHFVQV